MLISVRVIPRSSKNSIEWEQGTLKVRLTSPPVDGAANQALIALLSQCLTLPKRNISIIRGISGRHKTLQITGMTDEEVKLTLTARRDA